MKLLVVVEDDVAMQILISVTLSMDSRFDICGAASTAQEAIELAGKEHPDLVILDHFIDGDIMGLDAAPLIKEVSPESMILLFTSHELSLEASREPAIDGYLSKTNIQLLLPKVIEMLDVEPPIAV